MVKTSTTNVWLVYQAMGLYLPSSPWANPAVLCAAHRVLLGCCRVQQFQEQASSAWQQLVATVEAGLQEQVGTLRKHILHVPLPAAKQQHGFCTGDRLARVGAAAAAACARA